MSRWISAMALVNFCFAAVPCSAARLVVRRAADTGNGSLRDAITQSNANGEEDTILFAAGLTGKTIQPATPLPALTEGNTTLKGDREQAGKPDIIIDASKCGGTGIEIQSAANTIRGLCVIHSSKAIAITGPQATDNTVFSCHLGTDLAGAQAQSNEYGVYISGGASRNTVGGPVDQRRNLISGNTAAGVVVSGGDANAIVGNCIGTDAAGMAAIPNAVGVVVRDGATGTQIGGNRPALGNLVSASTGAGIQVLGQGTSGTRIVQNGIGTNSEEVAFLCNTGPGIEITRDAGEVTIGEQDRGNIIGVRAQGEGIVVSSANASGTQINDNGITTHIYEPHQGYYGIKIDLRYADNARFAGRIDGNEFFKLQESIALIGDRVTPTVVSNSFRWCRDGITIDAGARPDLGDVGDQKAKNDGGNKFGDLVLAINNLTGNAIKAEGNDWGTTSRSEIEQKIHDKRDDPKCGPVDFDPLAGGASPGP